MPFKNHVNDREFDKFVEIDGETVVRTTQEGIDVQNPLPVDGDSVYEKDVWLAQSTSEDFTGGDVTDLFNDLHSVITNVTSSNPKTILVHFNRTVVSNVVGLGAYAGNFSNVKIEVLVSGHTATTVIDESSSNTKYTSRTFQLPVTLGINALRITFHTADAVSLSNVVMLKSISVVARLQAKKPDNTVTDINATAGNNLKVAIEEVDESTTLPTVGFFNTNDIEEASSTLTYIGAESANGTWYIKKIDTSSGNSFQHATETNNPTRTTYTLGWTNRATLTYQDYTEAF